MDLTEARAALHSLGADPTSIKSLEQAMAIARGVVHDNRRPAEALLLASMFFGVPRIIARRSPPCGRPRGALVRSICAVCCIRITIEIFFQLAIAADPISSAPAIEPHGYKMFVLSAGTHLRVQRQAAPQMCVKPCGRTSSLYGT